MDSKTSGGPAFTLLSKIGTASISEKLGACGDPLLESRISGLTLPAGIPSSINIMFSKASDHQNLAESVIVLTVKCSADQAAPGKRLQRRNISFPYTVSSLSAAACRK